MSCKGVGEALEGSQGAGAGSPPVRGLGHARASGRRGYAPLKGARPLRGARRLPTGRVGPALVHY